MENVYRAWFATMLLFVGIQGEAGDYKPEALASGRADPSLHLQQSTNQSQAQQINEVIYKATGFGNTFMIVTDEGNVIVDTSMANIAPLHKKLLTDVSSGPIHSIILTHGHGDHTGGVELWRQPATKVIAQENMVEFLRYQKRLEGMFNRSNRAQFGFDLKSEFEPTKKVENFAATILPDTLFDKELIYTLGGKVFQVLHTPAETYDALTVWMPQYKAAFVGDMFYESFPNMYTLRGTKPRWALDYIHSLNRVLALEPEILLPSHGNSILGKENIRKALTRYRDAIQYVHNKTVKGMNQGKDVYSLMREIKLPDDLNVGESYGWVSWSVRGIFEGYKGWFDGNPVTMYDQSPESVYKDLVSLSGGADKVVTLAGPLLENGDTVKALRLVEAALVAEPNNRAVLELRLKVLTMLRKNASNLNESGWLDFGIKQTQQKLAEGS
jgi:alkyl sulfatase BDS1-like metallo-beta-lactamase superfamily hydrolase